MPGSCYDFVLWLVFSLTLGHKETNISLEMMVEYSGLSFGSMFAF